MSLPKAHEALADLLQYPVDGLLPSALERLRSEAPELYGQVAELEGALAAEGATAMEELYARTFDNNAERALEVGWQLHGENYDRGAFLVRMRDMLRRKGIAEGSELPDHLAHVLRAIGRSGTEDAAELVRTAVLPATRKMLEGFREANPYRGVLEAVIALLESHLAVEEAFHV